MLEGWKGKRYAKGVCKFDRKVIVVPLWFSVWAGDLVSRYPWRHVGLVLPSREISTASWEITYVGERWILR